MSLLVIFFGNLHCIGIIHQRPGDVRQQFIHKLYPLDNALLFEQVSYGVRGLSAGGKPFPAFSTSTLMSAGSLMGL